MLYRLKFLSTDEDFLEIGPIITAYSGTQGRIQHDNAEQFYRRFEEKIVQILGNNELSNTFTVCRSIKDIGGSSRVYFGTDRRWFCKITRHSPIP